MPDPNPQIMLLRDQAVEWGPRILAAILILVITYFLAKGVKWAIARVVDRIPGLQRESAARPSETVGRQIGTLGYRSEEHTSELQSLMRISYAVFCLKKKTKHKYTHIT